MAYDVKFAYISGFNLVFTAYQPDGSGRGIPEQPLPELAEGYYSGSPLTDLVAGDEVIAYVLENVTWEGELVYILTYGSIYWEGDRVAYDGDWVYSYDDADVTNELLTSVGAVVGGNEYSINALDFSLILTGITDLIIGQQTQNPAYDDSGLTIDGQSRQLSSTSSYLLSIGKIGYVKTEMG